MSNKQIITSILFLFVIKISAIYLTNFNLFGDEAQYWLWSANLDLGYFSKPPFLAWFVRIYSEIFGNSFFSLKFIPLLAYILIACSFYILGKNLGLKKSSALNCALLFLLIPAVTFSSFIISTDIFLILFWILSLNELIKITKNPKLISFILLGIFLGLAFLSKYAAIYFLICLIVYFFVEKKFRNLFVENLFKFFMCLLCVFLIVLPNIYWNLNNDWITLKHTSDNANLKNIKLDFYRGFEFVLIQIFMLGPFLFLANLLNYKKIRVGPNKKILLVFSLPIFIIVLVEAIMVRANANWAAPALVSFFLFLYIGVDNIKNIYLKINLIFNITFCAVFYFLILISYPLMIFDRISDIDKFANIVYKESVDRNLYNLVVADRLLFSNLAYELRGKGLTFHMPHKDNEVITNHFKISSALNKNMNEKFILIGSPNDIKYLEQKYVLKKINSSKQKFSNRDIFTYEVSFD